MNALGVRTLAQAAARRGAHLVHVSTDYVFDGTATRPYDEWDAVHPISEYGRSKLGGELEVERHAGSWATVRTSWVFGRRGTDLVSWAFGAFDRGELDGVLADQVSIPTFAPDLAVLLARFAVERRQGLFHVTSGSEAVTRHELIVTALRARGVDPSGVAADRRRRPRPARGAPADERARQPRAAPGGPARPAPVARRGHRLREGLGSHERSSRGHRGGVRRAHHRRVPGAPRARRHVRRHRRRARARAVEGRGPDPRGRPARRWSPRASPSGRLRVRRRRGRTRRASAEFVFLCVPTPQGDDGAADLSFVEDGRPRDRAGAAAGRGRDQQVDDAGRLDPARRSGSSAEAGATDEVGVASNPEFLREGTSVRDFLHPNRVVIGCDDPAVAVRVVRALPRRCNAPILVTDPASAEMIKYASNAFLATKISFVNAIANLCEAVDADVREVALGMGYDQRIGFEFLHPGPGYGGSCFPKDTAALLHTADSAGYDFALLEGVVEVNQRQHERMVEKLRDARRRLARRACAVAVWGLTFKANTDDLRDSPALVDRAPAARGGRDACGPTTPRPASAAADARPGLEVVADPYDACDGRARARGAHRVGRVPLARLRPGASPRWRDPAVRRRPQPARPGRAAPAAASPTRASAADAARASSPAAPASSARTSATRCSHAGWDVVALDNLLTGRTREPRRPAPTTPGFTFVRARRHRRASRVDGPVDAVLHFASPASPPDYLAHPIKTLKVGSLGTRNTLGLALRQRRPVPARVDERGLRRPARAPAARELLGQRQPDRAARRCTTRRSASPRRSRWRTTARHGARHAIVRIFNTYGPRLRPADGRVVSNFLVAGDARASRSRSTATASRPGRSATSTTRCAGILALLESDHVGPMNIGNPNEFTMLELAELVLEVTGSSVGDRVRAAARSTTRRSAGPTSRSAREVLGWEPDGRAPRRSRPHLRLVPEERRVAMHA